MNPDRSPHDEVLETCKTKQWAEVQLERYAVTIKAMGYSEHLDVELQEARDSWQVVLVHRNVKGRKE